MKTRINNHRTLVIVNAAAFVVVLLVNFLSNALPLNGRSAGEISDALPSFFTPAGYTFSIWGLIYTALLGFIVYQALPAQRNRRFLGQVGWLFAASSAFNVAWLFSWHYGIYALSIVFMVALLVTLAAIYLRLDIGRRHTELSIADKILVHFPFSLYLGWITVATIANVASVVAYWGWNGLGVSGPTWSAIMMLVAAGVAGVLLFNRRNLAYAGVLVWALFGIRAAHSDVALIANTAVVAAIVIALFAIVGYVRTSRSKKGTSVSELRTA